MHTLYGELLESVGIDARYFFGGEEFFAAYSPSWQGGILLDLRMPGMSGIEVLRRLRAMNCHLPVVVVSSFGDVSSSVQAMKLGAIDFLEKPATNSGFIDAVQAMLAQSRRDHATQDAQDAVQKRLAKLSGRERTIAESIANGLTSREIGGQLAISRRTVDAHRAHILEKLECSSSIELAALLARVHLGPR